MTARQNRARRDRYAPRMHEVSAADRQGGYSGHHPPDRSRHAAIPTSPSGALSIVVGTEDACLRCEDGIVLTLTGWEHA